MCIAEDVYYTLSGQMDAAYQIPGVENAFCPGSACAENYAVMLAAYERLRIRLGQAEWDDDVEIIINTLLDNQKILCLKMFEYGQNKPHP